MYFVVQREGSGDHIKATLWCDVRNQAELDDFCQYHIDSCYDGIATDFYVITPQGEVGFYAYCESRGIRKRTFEERMEDRKAPLYV